MSLTSLLAEIAPIGRDPASGGYRRFAFTREDAALAEWFAATATHLGATVSRDRCGNQWAWWGDPDRAAAIGRPGVVTGSHLDSVPDGGAYDGPLGVTAALAAVEALLRRSKILDDVTAGATRPLGVVRFVDEEGARFGLACSGSRLLTGTVDPATVLALRDGDGVEYAAAVRAAGLTPDHIGPDPETLRRVGAFVELHVEQGKALATAAYDAPVGAASRIRPHGRWRFELTGRADHAGTTELADRDDPMLALARLVTETRAAAVRHEGLATIGRVSIEPNAVNAIPGRVRAWLDARADTETQVRAILADLALSGTVTEESWTPVTDFDPVLTERVAAAAGRALDGPPVPTLATGAGHDAGVLAHAGVPSAMLFVRNPTGVSHSPAETAQDGDCAAGVSALTEVLAELLSH